MRLYRRRSAYGFSAVALIGRHKRLNARLPLFLIVPMAERGRPLFCHWDYLSRFQANFQTKKGSRPQSLGSSILSSLDATDLIDDLCLSGDFVALGQAIQIRGQVIVSIRGILALLMRDVLP